MARPKLGEGDTKRLHLMISDEELSAIDDWRFAHRMGSRSEAVRRLVQMALTFDAGRHGFADTLFAKAEAELAVIDVAITHIGEELKKGDDLPENKELMEVMRRYWEADRAWNAHIRSMIDEMNFLQFALNPFINAEKRAAEKAFVLEELSKGFVKATLEDDQ